MTTMGERSAQVGSQMARILNGASSEGCGWGWFLPVALRWLGMLVLLTAFSGCTLRLPWRNASKTARPRAELVRRAMELWRPRLGIVVIVDQAAGFALIDIGTAPAPSAGTPLKAFTLEKEAVPKPGDSPAATAELVVSSFQRRPFLIADLRSGTPKIGDSIVIVERPASAARSGDRTAEPREPGFLDRSIPEERGTPPEKRSGAVPDSAVRRSGGEETPAGESEQIIPGIGPKPPSPGSRR